MKTKALEKAQIQKEEVQLVKGEFTPSEASHVILSLLDEKINFHKIQRLQLWEGDHKYDTEPLKKRIKELEAEKVKIQEFLARSPATGKNIKINGILNVSLVP